MANIKNNNIKGFDVTFMRTWAQHRSRKAQTVHHHRAEHFLTFPPEERHDESEAVNTRSAQRQHPDSSRVPSFITLYRAQLSRCSSTSALSVKPEKFPVPS